MNIKDMHVWFRQYAQQMGMQNVRAILPEQIDIVINTSIQDILNQLIRENVGITNDRIITDNVKLGQINALRTLYGVALIEFANTDSDLTKVVPVSGKSGVGLFRLENVMSDTSPLVDKGKAPLYLVDLSLDYQNNVGSVDDPSYTNYFPIRFVEDSKLADSLQDFVLKPRVRTPIAVFYDNQLDIYLGEDFKQGNGLLSAETLFPHELRVSLIKQPNKVKYVSDLGTGNVDCDLPESMHIDILKHAVDLYNTSISGNLYAAQQQQQNQNREMSRNVARPDNEGYQS